VVYSYPLLLHGTSSSYSILVWFQYKTSSSSSFPPSASSWAHHSSPHSSQGGISCARESSQKLLSRRVARHRFGAHSVAVRSVSLTLSLSLVRALFLARSRTDSGSRSRSRSRSRCRSLAKMSERGDIRDANTPEIRLLGRGACSFCFPKMNPPPYLDKIRGRGVRDVRQSLLTVTNSSCASVCPSMCVSKRSVSKHEKVVEYKIESSSARYTLLRTSRGGGGGCVSLET
jgi:hypothetical protein